MSEDPREREQLLSPQDIDKTSVYPIIHMIRQDITHYIDTPLTYEAIMAPDLTYTLVKPLADKYINIQSSGNRSVAFCLLLNRVHFLRDDNLVTSPLSRSRATLCEVLAIRTLREYGDSILDLALSVTTAWPVYSGADEDLLHQTIDDMSIDEPEQRLGNAIEMAILGKAKRFIKSAPCQKVIDGIWTGKCVYQAESSHSILSDTYKRTPMHIYDPHKAPLLDHYRLKVPAVRSVLDYIKFFIILFALFILALELNKLHTINWAEGVFMIYALGFSLEKFAAMQEHGLRVYFKGTWNGFDLAFITIFCTYACLRLYGVHNHSLGALVAGNDCLALVACLVFPRFIFVTFKNNLMVLSLRAMLVQFFVLMLIAIFCFIGFLYALWTLSRNQAHYSAGQIAWWMADLWFGLDASGFEHATSFHPILGPVLMVTYTCLSNTLLLTVLVSILSHTFSTISEDAAAEAMFRRAVSTIEGVKADSLFSYQPPINLIAVLLMLPASYILTPRWFHKVNVFMIRATSFPILLAIAYYERQTKEHIPTTFTEVVSTVAERVVDTMPRQIKRLTFLDGLFAGGGSDIDMIFEIEEEMAMSQGGSALDLRDLPESAGKGKDSREIRRTSTSSSHLLPRTDSKTSTASQPPSPASRRVGSSVSERQAPRGRLNSIRRGTDQSLVNPSPLAQIYQPFTVSEEILEEPNQGNNIAGISYGPATRRRLSSMNRATELRKFPSIGSGSHLPFSSPVAKRTPETANEALDDEISAGGDIEMTERLKSIEERQKRIEDLLVILEQRSNNARTV